MTLRKKLTSLALAGVMALGMVGSVGVSAATSNDFINTENHANSVSDDEDFLNPNHAGTYYNGTSFIRILPKTSNPSEYECIFYQVQYDSLLYSGVTDIALINGLNVTFKFSAGNYYWINANGGISFNYIDSLDVQGTKPLWSNDSITIGSKTYSK